MRRLSTNTLSLLFVFFYLFSVVQWLPAQQPAVKQVFTVSGGVWGNDDGVKVNAYRPADNSLIPIDTVTGNYTNDILVDGNALYFTADTFLYKYDLSTYQPIDTLLVPGVNDLAIHNNKLIVTRWFPATSNYVQVYNKQSLQLLYSDTNVLASNGIAVIGNKAYIAEQGSFPAFTDSGTVGVIDLNTLTHVNTIKLDTFVNPVEDIHTDGAYIYAIAPNKGYVGQYDPVNDTLYSIATGVTGGALSPYNDQLYANYNQQLRYFNTVTRQVEGTPLYGDYYAGGFDTVNQEFYLTETDFFSYGSLIRVNTNGQIMDSLAIGVSPEKVAVDYRNHFTGLNNDTANTQEDQATGLTPLSNDINPANVPLTMQVTDGPYNGTVNPVTSDSLVYQPDSGYAGSDFFVYEACDNLYPQKCEQAVVHVNVMPVSGIQPELSARIQLYPNPVGQQLFLRSSQAVQKATTLVIKDVLGQVWRQQSLQNVQAQQPIPVKDLPPGLYFLELRNEQQTLGTTKFIKK